MEKIYLASKSPRRAELLTRLGIEYEILSAEVDETVSGKPEDCVKILAQRKAAAGAQRVSEGWVLAADTLVFLNDQPLGKPADAEDAVRMLHSLSGRTHRVLTGMCLVNARTGEQFTRCDGADITFDEMTDEEIASYVAGGEPMDKAGAYGIQDQAGIFVQALEGDYYNVMGLPLCSLVQKLREHGVCVLGSN